MIAWLRWFRAADVLSATAIALLIYTSVESLLRACTGEAAPLAPPANGVVPPSFSALGSAIALAAVIGAALFLRRTPASSPALRVALRGLGIAIVSTAVGLGVAVLIDDWMYLGTVDIAKRAALYVLLVWLFLVPASIYVLRAKEPRPLLVTGLAAFGLLLQVLSIIVTVATELVMLLVRTARRAARGAI